MRRVGKVVGGGLGGWVGRRVDVGGGGGEEEGGECKRG